MASNERTTSVETLKGSLNWCDGLAQEATSEIEALSRAARHMLSQGRTGTSTVACLLVQIENRADTLRASINSEAEKHGANFNGPLLWELDQSVARRTA